MKKKIGFLITCLIIISIVPIRIYQYFNNIEISTGFYKENDLTHIFFTGLIIVGIIISLVLFFQTKKSYKELDFPKEKSKNIVLGIMSMLFAIGFLLFANVSIIHSFKTAETNDPLTILLYAIFSIVAIICFVYMSIKFFLGKSLPNSVACILPAIIMLIRLIQTYISNFTIKNISEFPLIILMINSSLLFYLFFARIISGYKSAKFYSWASIFSAITAIFCFASASSRFVVQIMDYSLITAENQPMYIDLITGFIAIVFLGFLVFSREKQVEEFEQELSDDGFVHISSINQTNEITEL